MSAEEEDNTEVRFFRRLSRLVSSFQRYFFAGNDEHVTQEGSSAEVRDEYESGSHGSPGQPNAEAPILILSENSENAADGH